MSNTHLDILLESLKLLREGLDDHVPHMSSMRDVPFGEIRAKEFQKGAEFRVLCNVDRLEVPDTLSVDNRKSERSAYLIVGDNKVKEVQRECTLTELDSSRFEVLIEGILLRILLLWTEFRYGNGPPIIGADIDVFLGMVALEVSPEVVVAGLLCIDPSPGQRLLGISLSDESRGKYQQGCIVINGDLLTCISCI